MADEAQAQGGGTSGFAIAAAPIGSVLGVIFGRRAKREIEASGGRLGGSGLATAGIILGWIGIVLTVLAVAIAILADA